MSEQRVYLKKAPMQAFKTFTEKMISKLHFQNCSIFIKLFHNLSNGLLLVSEFRRCQAKMVFECSGKIS